MVYGRNYEQRYSANPVEDPDVCDCRLLNCESFGYMFIEPEPCSLLQISKVHGSEHIDRVRLSDHFEMASLAAAGAICAAELALQGKFAFALVRPPGHHASANRAWGMCYFNNMAIAIKKIRPRAKKALIIDIDLHHGDGTASIFWGDHNARLSIPGR